MSRIAASWRRSLDKHGLDPAAGRSRDRVTAENLRWRKEQAAVLLRIAGPKLDQLFGLVGHSGCTVALTDAQGIVIEQRYSLADADAFNSWGLAQGADWSESAEGTNGIGTCLAEQRHVIIHRHEHFLARNVGMSCMDAPIYGADGALAGALDVSSARADQTEAFNQLIAAMAVQTARHIEAETFRAAFPKARIICADNDSAETALLLAVDEDDIVIGATRSARKVFGLDVTGPVSPLPASDLLGQEDGPTGFEKAERAAVNRALTRANGNVSKAARALGIGRATLYRRMKRLSIGEFSTNLSQS